MNIFNEKTSAFLDLKGYNNTTMFFNTVTTLWNCISVKSKDAWFKLNNKNRKPFESADDQGLESILQLPQKFEDMDTSESPYSGRVMCLTQDASNALHLTLNGIVSFIKLLLNKEFNYVLPGSFQRDRLEGEFGTFCQSASGYYHISVEQIMNSLALQRFKLFSKLDINSLNAKVAII